MCSRLIGSGWVERTATRHLPPDSVILSLVADLMGDMVIQQAAEEVQRVPEMGHPLLVLGGPGTGKTRFLEDRYLDLARAGVAPHRILLLCSSRSYSIGARDRLVRSLPHQATVEVPVYTWHGLAYHLVTRYYPHLGYRELPVLLTAPEQWGVVRELLEAEDRKDWPVWGERLAERAFIDEVADFCLRLQQQLMSTEELEAFKLVRPDWEEVIRFYGRYRSFINERARLDYAELIASAWRLLETNPPVRSSLRSRFPHVLVDDAQDMSQAHLNLLCQLEKTNLVVAADPDSGIETFRGAQPDWVYGFQRWFGPSRTLVLRDNQRIGEPLATAVMSLIRHNDEAEHRPVSGNGQATTFECRMYPSIAEEVEAIARELRKRGVVDGLDWSEMAVLISQPRHLLGPLQRALEHYEVPYQPMGGERPLTTEPAIRYFLDLVRVALEITDTSRVLPQLLTTPLIGLDLPTRRHLEREAWRTRRSLREVVTEAAETDELEKLCRLVVEFADRADECFWQVWSASRYYRELAERARKDPSDPANAAVDAIVTFSQSLERFVSRRQGAGSIGQYLNEAARADFGADPWLRPPPDTAPGVALVSFHGSKGREWDTVIVAGCLDAWIPKGRRSQGLFDPYALQTPDVVDRQLEAIADDRRTFYVAATRARSHVVFTVSPPTGARTRPSRFLLELAGSPPLEAEAAEPSPLTARELRAGLRGLLDSKESSPGERVAALIALSEMPGTDPGRWYGRWDWSEGGVPLVEDGVLRTSYSRLGAFENCGLQYALQSVLGLDPSSTHSMKFGTWIHALFQAVHDNKIADPHSLLQEYERIFDASLFPNATVARQFHRDGIKMLEIFWREEVSQRTVLAEHGFTIEFAGARLRGRIDRIDRVGRALKLTDYKTAKWAPSRVDAEKSLQLAIYHLAAKMDPQLVELGTPEQARLVYPGAFDRYGRHIVLEQNAEQAESVLSELPATISAVLEEHFNPKPDADCYFCKMKPLCPLWPEGRELGT
jgi:superfamily I DNA/RNA helicase/RecB family exonuclease